MNTQALMLEYRRLLRSDPKAAKALVEKHRSNELFSSLIEFRDNLIEKLMEEAPAIEDAILAAKADSDPAIREVLIESAKETFSAKLAESLGL